MDLHVISPSEVKESPNGRAKRSPLRLSLHLKPYSNGTGAKCDHHHHNHPLHQHHSGQNRISPSDGDILNSSPSCGKSSSSCIKRNDMKESSPPHLISSSPTAILSFLFLGNQSDASDLKKLEKLNISFILSVTQTPLDHLEGIRYKRLPALDSYRQNLIPYFEEAFNFIDEARKSGSNILIHCQEGISRSPTITIGYLMRHEYMDLIEAYKLVKSKRPVISPNLSFMGQLLELERSRGSDPQSIKRSLLLPDTPRL